jgi:alkaline phosphatase D
VQRRRFLKAILAGVALLASGLRSRLGYTQAVPERVFRHGVASGDPSADGIILWTRVSAGATGSVAVHWQVAEDTEMTRIVASGNTTTDASRDFTVKIDAGGLPSGATLYYQFRALGSRSTVGRTRTLPAGQLDIAKFAVVSCANHPNGYFHVYREIAARTDLDAVLHLGDYIYEYGATGYASEHAEALGRIPEPAHELQSLQDYRQRHAQYKSDPDSQAMLGSLPLIAVWDDHELANDSWRDGAENHSPEEGSWAARRDAAIQAYFEWMPIRGTPKGKKTRIFREFRYGNLASLIMLDSRLYGRDPQPYVEENATSDSIAAAMADPKRRMLGRTQERWLRKRLERAAGTTWQLIGQQVLVTKLTSANLEPLVDPDGPSILSKERLKSIIDRSNNNPPSVLDAWDGYPLAREDLYADLRKFARNPVLLSGDLHTNLAADLIPKDADKPLAVEFMAGAVSSPVIAELLPEYTPHAVRDAMLGMNPGLKYLETRHRGWLCLTLTDEHCTGEWHLVDTVRSRDYRSWLDKTLSVRAGEIEQGLQG